MRAGKLRHRIVIETLTAGSPDQLGTGEIDEAWATYLTVWGSVEPLDGKALFAAQQNHSEVEVRIAIRYQSGITAKMRVSYGGKYYNILAVIDPELRNRELHLLCSQGVNDG